MAITWKNIDAPSFGAANLLMQSGSNRISEGIQSLQSLAAQQGQDAQADIDETTQKNTQSVLDNIYSLSSMEDYDNALQQGQFSADTLKSTYGDQVDVNAVRDALMQRDNQIATDETDRYNYDQTIQKRADAPIIDQQLQNLYSLQNPNEVGSFISGIGDLNISEDAKTSLIKQANDTKNSLLDQAYQRTVRGREAAKFQDYREDRTLIEEQRFVDRYDELGKFNNNTNLSDAQSNLDSLDEKYPIPEGFEETYKQGTSLNAVDSWLKTAEQEDTNFLGLGSGYDRSKVLTNVQNTFMEDDKAIEFNAVIGEDSDGNPITQKYTYDTAPAWIMDQALKSIELPSQFWGDELPSSVTKKLKKEFGKAVSSYGVYVARKNAKEAARQEAQNRAIQAQVLEQQRIQQGRKAFKKSKN